jgi:LysM repeat protein
MVLVNEPGADGKIVHTVQPYQTLITIAQAYHVSVDTILAQNGWQKDWPLQIGQKLVISAGGPGGTAVALALLGAWGVLLVTRGRLRRLVAVLAAVLFGAWGLILFPGQTSAPSLGLVPVEAWLLAGVLYVVLVAAVQRLPNAKALLGFAQPLRQAPTAPAAPAAPEAGG